MSESARLKLPFLSSGQAQKEAFHNEALQILDMVAAAAIQELPRNDPPTSPTLGACYLIGPSPTADWAGQGQSIAGYTAGGWRYIAPFEGMSVLVKASGVFGNYLAGTWEFGALRGDSLMLGGQQVVGSRLPAINEPSGGSIADVESRTAIGQILATLRQHGLIES